jgi:hypothetical protein
MGGGSYLCARNPDLEGPGPHVLLFSSVPFLSVDNKFVDLDDDLRPIYT